jgi:hypothetical protein
MNHLSFEQRVNFYLGERFVTQKAISSSKFKNVMTVNHATLQPGKYGQGSFKKTTGSNWI